MKDKKDELMITITFNGKTSGPISNTEFVKRCNAITRESKRIVRKRNKLKQQDRRPAQQGEKP